MAVTAACIASEEIYRPWDASRVKGARIEARQTPFGQSGDIFLIDDRSGAFYLVPRYGAVDHPPMPGGPAGPPIRATMYALKDLGVRHVIGWAPGGAIRHTMAVGDVVVLTDLIDRTYLREKTFFAGCPWGRLRQFPVFCPRLRRSAGQALHEMKLVYHGAATAAVTEGPRLETPAEIRALAATDAAIVTHAFVPEVFLAKELQMCYAALCYVVDYAETGSRHPPFTGSDLFGGLTARTQAERLAAAVGALPQVIANIVGALDQIDCTCQCDSTMADHIREYRLPQDWHEWLT